MAIDSKEKRASVIGVGRPYLRDKFPIASPDPQWRASSGLAYGAYIVSVTVSIVAVAIASEVDTAFATVSARAIQVVQAVESNLGIRLRARWIEVDTDDA